MTNAATIEFMTFWLTMNKLLATRGLAEMRWGEARQFWQSAREEQESANNDRIAQILNRKAG